MWIMITSKILVAVQHQPKPLDIYWGIPWTENKPKLSEVLKSMTEEFMNDLLREVITDSDIRPYIQTYSNGNRVLRNKSILDDDEIVERLWDIIVAMRVFPDYSPYGNTPNKNGMLRVMVGDEAVGVFPHECSILSLDDMEAYLEESHILVMSDVSKEVFGIFDEDQKFIKDAAMLDGCVENQAGRVALGKGVEFDFPIPLGYYSCNEELRSRLF